MFRPKIGDHRVVNVTSYYLMTSSWNLPLNILQGGFTSIDGQGLACPDMRFEMISTGRLFVLLKSEVGTV